MSTPVFTNEGEKRILDFLTAGMSRACMLFKNNYTPVAASVFADFTDADFSGYSAGGAALSYAAATTNGGGQSQSLATQVSFSHNGGGTANDIYGYAIYDSVSSKILKAERFDTLINMAASGDVIKITDKFLAAGTIT